MTQFDTGPSAFRACPTAFTKKKGATSVKRPPLGASVKAQVSFAEALTQAVGECLVAIIAADLLAMCS
jgi:hypothetical protein